MKTLKFQTICYCHPHKAGGLVTRRKYNFLETIQSDKSGSSWKLDGSCNGSLALFHAGHFMTCMVSHQNLGVPAETGNEGGAPEFSQRESRALRTRERERETGRAPPSPLQIT